MCDKITCMDIFIINKKNTNNISDDLLREFEHKNFSNKKKWQEHCLAYLMLDRILKEVYKISDREIEFINNKPHLRNKKKFFSLSHSEDYVVIAFSNSDCGIDIELIKERDYKKIAKRMKLRSNSIEEFYYDWTKYEAEYKLKNKTKSLHQTRIENYILTAVSSNPQEIFEIYIQNRELFPNLQN